MSFASCSYHVLRNAACGALALALLATGRVRRARNRALSSPLVTAIYFHNPEKRLFRRCVEWLVCNGYTFISESELLQILSGAMTPPRGAVWLSFDDGFNQLLDNVLPLVSERRIPITIFIPSGIVGGDGHFPWLHAGVGQNDTLRHSITVADLRAIAQLPWVAIGSHTVKHATMTTLSEDEMSFQLRESKRVLESWTGRRVISFAYPEGRLTGREAFCLLECGYELAATTRAGLIEHDSQRYFVPRLHVGDQISFPEAVCNMTAVWRPVIDQIFRRLHAWGVLPVRLQARFE